MTSALVVTPAPSHAFDVPGTTQALPSTLLMSTMDPWCEKP